jgi:hypothetical protein
MHSHHTIVPKERLASLVTVKKLSPSAVTFPSHCFAHGAIAGWLIHVSIVVPPTESQTRPTGRALSVVFRFFQCAAAK